VTVLFVQCDDDVDYCGWVDVVFLWVIEVY